MTGNSLDWTRLSSLSSAELIEASMSASAVLVKPALSSLYSGVISFSKSHFHSYANNILSEYWGLNDWADLAPHLLGGGSSLKAYRSLRLCLGLHTINLG